MIHNNTFKADFSDKGQLIRLEFNKNASCMNWVVDPSYLSEAGYKEADKLFGSFDLSIGDQTYQTQDVSPSINLSSHNKAVISYDFDRFKLNFIYDLSSDPNTFDFHIPLLNKEQEPLVIRDFGVWTSFAYIMFRDKDILKNIRQSAAFRLSLPTIRRLPSTGETIRSPSRSLSDGRRNLFRRYLLCL